MEVKISQDIRKYKTKDIGNFSFREAGFIAAGLAVGFVTYKLTNSLEVAIVPAGVILVFGFFKPYGLSAWQFIRTVLKESILPQCYINETDFEYNFDEWKQLYGEDVVIPADCKVIQTGRSVKINKSDRAKLIK